MSELARTARRQMRDKARKMIDGEAGKVDASDYGPEEDLKAGVKTGLRPISRRQFRKGGKVLASEGKEAVKHAGRKPRKAGGSALADDFVNRDVREANEKRDGDKHVGGFKRGGRTKREDGGEVPTSRFSFSPSSGSRMTQAAGLKTGGKAEGRFNFGPAGDSAKGEMKAPKHAGKAEGGEKIKGATLKSHPDEPQDRKLIKKMVKAQDLTGRKDGGRTKRSTGGDLALGLASPMGLLAKKGLKTGGSALDGELQGTRPTGGREAHAKGGPAGYHVVGSNDGYVYGRKKTQVGAERAMEARKASGGHGNQALSIKPIHSASDYGLNQHPREARKSGGRTGKTDINIIIGAGGQKPGMTPPVGAAPTMPPGQPIPVPMPPAGGAAGLGGGAAPANVPPPQMPPPGPPMPRKAGGRAEYPLDAGAGSGEGRVQKLGWYGRSQDR